jgi:hypothetical protein
LADWRTADCAHLGNRISRVRPREARASSSTQASVTCPTVDVVGWALLALESHPRASRTVRAALRRIALRGFAAHALLAELDEMQDS